MDECGEKNAISLSWGRREIRISGEGATLYVNGVPVICKFSCAFF